MHYLSSREKKNGLQKDAAEDAHLIRAISLDATCRHRLFQPLTMPSVDAEQYKSAYVAYCCLFLYLCLHARELASPTRPFSGEKDKESSHGLHCRCTGAKPSISFYLLQRTPA